MFHYGVLDRLLHQLALGSQSTAALSFALEQKLFEKDQNITRDEHVFIAGLARSGSTLLLETLYRSGSFATQTYSDMPFVLAPNLSKTIFSKKKSNSVLQTRAHGDAIKISLESPEAFEEVFWKNVVRDDDCQKDHSGQNFFSERVMSDFFTFIKLVLCSKDKRRYLSKNNNNIVRIRCLQSALPKAKFIIPIRRPLDHAASLLRQHDRFLASQAEDKFIKTYMDYLGHHEFGIGHVRIQSGAPLSFTNNKTRDSSYLDYWLHYWTEFHSGVIESGILEQKNTLVVDYDNLCRRGDEGIQAVCNSCSLEFDTKLMRIEKSIHKTPKVDKTLLKIANEIYLKLKQQSIV